MRKFLSKKYFFRFLSFVSFFCILSSFFLINSSAETPSNPDLVYDGFKVVDVDVTMYSSVDGSQVPVSVTVSNGTFTSSDGGNRLTLTVRRSDGLPFYSEYYHTYVVMHFTNDSLKDTQYFLDVDYDFITYRSSIENSIHPKYTFGERFYLGTPHDYSDVSLRTDGGFSYNHFSFHNGDAAVPYNVYISSFWSRFKNDTTKDFYIFLDNVEFNILTPEEKSSQVITDNQDKNTDKILNGGHDNPSYSAPDTNEYDRYEDAENNLESGSAEYLEDTSNFFEDFDLSFRTSSIWIGLNAVSNIFNKFLDIPLFAQLTRYSLVLGAFSFLLGLASFTVSSFRIGNARKESSEVRRSTIEKNNAQTSYYNRKS